MAGFKKAFFGVCQVLALLAACVRLQGQPEMDGPIEVRYSSRDWTISDGLPDPFVSDMVRDQHGYLWVATYHGLVRFDGQRMRVFSRDSDPALPFASVTAMTLAGDGILWLGDVSGRVAKYHEGRFEEVLIPSQSESLMPIALATGADGNLWMMNTAVDLVRVDDGLVFNDPIPWVANPAIVTGLLENDPTDGTLYAMRRGWLYRLNSEPEVVAIESEGWNGQIVACLVSEHGGIWLLTQDRLGFLQEGRISKEYSLLSEPLHPSSCGMIQVGPDRFLVGFAEGGVFELVLRDSDVSVQRVGLIEDSWITNLSIDRDGLVWVGTASSGFALLRVNEYETLIADDRWGNRPVKSVFMSSSGRLFVGTEGSGLYYQEGTTWTRHSISTGMSNNYVWSFAETQSPAGSTIWVGTWGGGLNALDEAGIRPVPGWPEEYHSIATLCAARDGSVWAGTNRGLVRYFEGQFKTFGVESGLSSPQIRSLVEGPDGRIWFGTLGGSLGCIDREGNLTLDFDKEGLFDDNIGFLHFDRQGLLWLGTNSSGLLNFRDGRMRRIDRGSGLITNNIAGVYQTEEGDYWISSNRGVFAVSGESIQAIVAGESERVELSVVQDGLDRIDAVLGSQHVMTPALDGRLFFAGRDRVVGIRVNKVKEQMTPLKALIEEFRVDGLVLWDSAKARGNLASIIPTVVPGSRRFEFRFSVPSMSDGSRINLLYKLEGVDSKWTEIGEERMVVYQRLGPGSYRLSVAAKHESQEAAEPGSSLVFQVQPFWWEITWIQLTMAAAILALAVFLVLWRMNEITTRRTELLRRQQELERERMRIARDLHDDLGSSLTHIALLCAELPGSVESRDSQNQRIAAIHNRATNSIQQMDEIVWAVNPKHDSLESLANYLTQFVQAMTRAAGISCRLEIPLELPDRELGAEVRHNMFLACKEAIHNAVQHSGATRIALRILTLENAIQIRVEDDGKGIGVDATSGGMGLQSMCQRASEVGGEVSFDKNRERGLSVVFQYPLAAIAKPRQN